ncbi:MAG: hypothetical protein AABX17_03510 [Nanoarchaeota archaeon]
MNKKGLIGKIILAVILLVILFVGITIWQVYGLVKTATTDGLVITTNIGAITAKGSMLNKTDCDKLPEIEASVNKLKAKLQSSCMNPLIKIAVDKMQQIAIKCKDIPTLETQVTQGLGQIKLLCSNFGVVNLTQTEIPSELLNFTNATQ